jgi:hypothetical protein
MGAESETKWTSLERANFMVSVVSLITSAAVAIALFYYGDKLENAKWKNQTLVTKKLKLYEEMMPNLNHVLCYMCDYGTYKEYTPLEIIRMKRDLNLTFYTNRDLFSQSFQDEYKSFMDSLCFKPFSGQWDSQFRKSHHYVARGFEEIHGDTAWQEEWNEMFAGGSARKKEIEEAYYRMMHDLLVDAGMNE